MRYLTILLISILSLPASSQFKTVPSSGEPHQQSDLSITVPHFKQLKTAADKEQFHPVSLDFTEHQSVLNRPRDKQVFYKGTMQITVRDQAPENLVNMVVEDYKKSKPLEEDLVFAVENDATDELGIRHISVQQVYKNVPLYGGELKVHFYPDRTYLLNGQLLQSFLALDTEPTISLDQAVSTVTGDLGPQIDIADTHRLFQDLDHEPVLNIVNIDGKYRLAYQHTVYKNIAERWIYFVDAHTGEILDKHLAICKLHHLDNAACADHSHVTTHNTALLSDETIVNGPVVSNAQDLFGVTREINTYEINNSYFMIDAARSMYDIGNSALPNEPVGAIWTIDAFNTSPQRTDFSYDHVVSDEISFNNRREAVSAHYNGGIAYEYFKQVHNRESINGSRGNIISLVNVSDENGNSMGNAFWNGIGIFYGNGDQNFQSLARALDVAGHELSHGVIQSTANLQYRGESGALNESFADIFGVMIERENWTVGEQVVRTTAFPSGALRSLSDPHNGASTGDFARGWQPAKYSERYTGSEDNGGVHINSGIPNHAFYRFANHSDVGVERAEQVYYRALTQYLTASSQFVDARNAVIQSALDLYGNNVAAAAGQAFDAVEVFGGSGGDYENDVEVNPGSDLILFTTETGNNIYVADAQGNLLFNPLTEYDPISVPNVTDDGSEVIFVDSDNTLRYVYIDWETGEAQEAALSSDPIWRNAVFSKDGLRMAAVTATLEPELFVYDFVSNTSNIYKLVNPTYTSGVFTDNVQYADAMEFDFSGEYVMYDAVNAIKNSSGSNIEYWDISFIKVFDRQTNTFASANQISKLFTNIEEGISIGNPTFSKNSPYIIAFDLLQNGGYDIAAANTETQQVGRIFQNLGEIGYPHYSKDDDIVVFNATSGGSAIIAGRNTTAEKINGTGEAFLFLGFSDTGIKWGRWFSNGDRNFSSVDNEIASQLTIYPNPVVDKLTVKLPTSEKVHYTITNLSGKVYKQGFFTDEMNVDIKNLAIGAYILTIKSDQSVLSRIFIKG